MLKPRFTGSFKRERKLIIKRGRDGNKLTDVMGMIINEQPLPPERENHPLHGMIPALMLICFSIMYPYYSPKKAVYYRQ
jgi:mRNA-degrading endonuclease YafQ of YafQ-DinJ toxin-antitoxin module